MTGGRAPYALAHAQLAGTVLAELAAVPLSIGLEPGYDTWLYAIYSIAQATAGAAIARRHPRNAVGWLLLGDALFNALAADLGQGYGLRAADEGWPFGPFFEWLALGSWLASGGTMCLVFLLFPNGRLPGPRWRFVPALATVGLLLSLPGWLLDPGLGADFVAGNNPFSAPSWPTAALFDVGFGLFGVALIGSVTALLVRLRGARGDERQQLKWFAYGSTIAVVVLLVGAALWETVPEARFTSALALTAIPISAGVAILRYRLYDIDLVINRTLVYGLLTVVLGVSYAAVAILLGTSLGRGSAWVTAGATLVVAVAFRPVRARIQDAVDRRFDRRKWDALHRMDTFLESLAAGEGEPEEVVLLLRHAVGDETLELTGRTPDVHHGPLTPEQQALLTALLARGALAVEMVGLRSELRLQLLEVEESRSRLVEAGDRERRRIERDLHDGAQQRLVSIGLALRHAQHGLGDGAGQVDETLEAAIAEVAGTIQELRQLTHGLPPAQLDAGLAPAFHELARRSSVRVEVTAAPERFARGLEAAAYFIGCEGLTNAVKHAGATRIDLSAQRCNGSLVVSVRDDGNGGARPDEGSGLRGLADRVAALGGTLTIASAPGHGTQLTAELPCES